MIPTKEHAAQNHVIRVIVRLPNQLGDMVKQRESYILVKERSFRVRQRHNPPARM